MQGEKPPMSWEKAPWVLGLSLLLAGCASLDTRTTVEQLTNARVAVEAAERADAKTFSPDNLRHAQDALAIAGDAYTGREFERAFAFAKKATIYARVAKSQTDQKRAEEKLNSAREQLNTLRLKTEAAMAALPASEGNTPAAEAVVSAALGVTPTAAPAAAPNTAAASGEVKP
jgi:hypothetical protein